MAAAPVLVRAYHHKTGQIPSSAAPARPAPLPPISAYAFVDILRSTGESREFQSAIDGIAEICARNHLSLAQEHGAHLPPVGEITDVNSTTGQWGRPGMKRVLTTVPEGSSGSSEGSRTSKKKGRALFGCGEKVKVNDGVAGERRIRIGSMGRTVSALSTTALMTSLDWPDDGKKRSSPLQRTTSEASESLQRLLSRGHPRDVS